MSTDISIRVPKEMATPAEFAEWEGISRGSANSAGVAISFGTRIEISVLIVQYLLLCVRVSSF